MTEKTTSTFSELQIKNMIFEAFNAEDGLRAEIKSDIKTEIRQEVMDTEVRVLVKIVSLAV